MTTRTRIIWRMEHCTENVGPHWMENKSKKLNELIFLICSNYNERLHPVPEEDNCEAADDWKYACYGAPSLKTLLHWFPLKYMKRLRGEGFVIRKFATRDSIIGMRRNQVVFDRSTATLLGEITPSTRGLVKICTT